MTLKLSSLPLWGTRRRSLSRGLSLVELMVGVTIGLFVVAAASMLVGTQLGENRKLVLETQLGQELRATADIIARELRRSGASALPWTHIATETGTANYNDRADLAVMGTSEVRFLYDRHGPEDRGDLGFKLESGVIKTRSIPGATPQALTDSESMLITKFEIIQKVIPEQTLPCPKLCAVTNGTECWPKLRVRAFTVTIEAQSVRNPEVKRSLQSEVRMRNDEVKFFVPGASGAGPSTAQSCPS
jgi:type II secretory pathway component PulJ